MAVKMPTAEQLAGSIQADGVEKPLKDYRGVGLPGRVLSELLKMEGEDWEKNRLFVACHSETPSRILRDMLKEDLPAAVLREIYCHPRLPQNLMVGLAESADIALLPALASNRFLTPQAMDVLIDRGSMETRSRLASNPALSGRHQEKLLADPSPPIRACLARRRQLEGGIVEELSRDKDVLVQGVNILSPGRSDDMLLGWADSDEILNQHFLLLRKKLPEKVLESLCFSKHESVQLKALARRKLNPDETLGWARSESLAVRLQIVQMPDLLPEVRLLMAKDPEEAVRRIMAADDSMNEAEAGVLMKDESPAVLLTLCENPRLPQKIVIRLCRHEDRQVRRMLCQRTDLPAKALELLLEEADEAFAFDLARSTGGWAGMPQSVAEQLGRSDLASVRAFAATSNHLTDASIQRLSYDGCDAVRMSLAANDAIPEPALQVLSADSNETVAGYAQERLESTVQHVDEKSKSHHLKTIVKRMLGVLGGGE